MEKKAIDVDVDVIIDSSNELFVSIINQYLKKKFSNQLYKPVDSLEKWPTLIRPKQEQSQALADDVILAAFDKIDIQRNNDVAMAQKIAEELKDFITSTSPNEHIPTFIPKNSPLYNTFPQIQQESPPENIRKLFQITKCPYSTMARPRSAVQNGHRLSPLPRPVQSRLSKSVRSILQLTKRF